MQGAIPVHETDRMQAGEYPQGRQPAQAAAEQQRAQDQGKEPEVAHGPGWCRAHAVFRRRDRYGNQLKLAKRVNLFDYSLEELQAVHEYWRSMNRYSKQVLNKEKVA